jgi:hypothetical protein
MKMLFLAMSITEYLREYYTNKSDCQLVKLYMSDCFGEKIIAKLFK